MKIVDELLFPYEITIDNNNHTVEENTTRVTKDGDVVYKTIGYFSSIDSAISRIVSIKIIEKNKANILTLKEYISEYRGMVNDIKTSLML